MAEGIHVKAEDYVKLQKALKDIDKKVARAMRKRLREAAGPIGRHVLEYGIDKMPSRGGLQAYLKGHSPISMSMRQTGAELWLGSRKKSQISLMNRGMLRHPVFADPDRVRSFGKNVVRQWTWVNQDVPDGAFTEALEHLPPGDTERLGRVVDDIMKELKL